MKVKTLEFDIIFLGFRTKSRYTKVGIFYHNIFKVSVWLSNHTVCKIGLNTPDSSRILAIHLRLGIVSFSTHHGHLG
jgi:hypothetical protein